MRWKSVSVWVAMLASGLAAAAPVKYKLNQDHAQVVFTIEHFGYSKTHGSFRDINGTLMFDENKVEDSSVDIVIKTISLDTGLEARDDDVRAADMLDVKRYPEIRFVSTKVMKDGKGLKVTGNLTMHGQTKPITLTAKLNKAGPGAFGPDPMAGFSATGSLKRSDFGITSMLPGIGDQLDLTIDVEFTKEKSAP